MAIADDNNNNSKTTPTLAEATPFTDHIQRNRSQLLPTLCTRRKARLSATATSVRYTFLAAAVASVVLWRWSPRCAILDEVSGFVAFVAHVPWRRRQARAVGAVLDEMACARHCHKLCVHAQLQSCTLAQHNNDRIDNCCSHNPVTRTHLSVCKCCRRNPEAAAMRWAAQRGTRALSHRRWVG